MYSSSERNRAAGWRKTVALAILAAAGGMAGSNMMGCGDESGKQGPVNENGVTGADVQRETAEAVETAARYAEKEKKEFIDQMREKIGDIEQRIEELREQAQEAGEEAEKQMNESLNELEEEKNQLEKDMEKLESGAAQTWDQTKEKIEKGLERVNNALDKLAPDSDA